MSRTLPEQYYEAMPMMMEFLCLTASYQDAPCGCCIGRCPEVHAESHARDRVSAERDLMYQIGMQLFRVVLQDKAPSKMSRIEPMCPLEAPNGWIIHPAA